MKTEIAAVARCVVKYLLIIARSCKGSGMWKILRTACVWQADTNHFTGDQVFERTHVTSTHTFKLIEIDEHCLGYSSQIIFVVRVNQACGKISTQFGREQVVDKSCLTYILHLAAKQQNRMVYNLIAGSGCTHGYQIPLQTFLPETLAACLYAVRQDTDIVRPVPFGQRIKILTDGMVACAEIRVN